MSRAERVKAEFVLTDAERAQLLGWAHGESARLAVRATIVLAWSVRAHVPDHAQHRLQAMLVLNGVLLVAAVVGLVLIAL